MADHVYFVLRKASDWIIRYDGDDFGPYSDRQDAIEDAVEAARQACAAGDSIGVYFENDRRKFQALWVLDA